MDADLLATLLSIPQFLFGRDPPSVITIYNHPTYPSCGVVSVYTKKLITKVSLRLALSANGVHCSQIQRHVLLFSVRRARSANWGSASNMYLTTPPIYEQNKGAGNTYFTPEHCYSCRIALGYKSSIDKFHTEILYDTNGSPYVRRLINKQGQAVAQHAVRRPSTFRLFQLWTPLRPWDTKVIIYLFLNLSLQAQWEGLKYKV